MHRPAATDPDSPDASLAPSRTGSTVLDVLTFQVNRHQYAVAVADVEEVLRATAIVPLPKAPTVVEGVIDYRGQIIPVLDLRARFGAPRRALQPDDHFVLVRAGRRIVALRADRAVGLAHPDDRMVRPIASVVAQSEYIAGLVALADGLVLIADVAAFLSESETAMLDDAVSALSRPPVGTETP